MQTKENQKKTKGGDLAVCPHAKKCGGCQYQGISYEEQLKKKQKQALDEMSRQDKMAMMMAFAQLILPVAVGVLAIFAFLIWFLGKFWLHAW